MRIVGIMLIVFIKEEHTNHLFDVMGATVGTGLMGMMVSAFYTHLVSIEFDGAYGLMVLVKDVCTKGTDVKQIKCEQKYVYFQSCREWGNLSILCKRKFTMEIAG